MSGSPFKKISKKRCAISMMQFRNKRFASKRQKPHTGILQKIQTQKWAENDSLPILILYKTIPFI